jgi:osmotically-inducible protein OsmY
MDKAFRALATALTVASVLAISAGAKAQSNETPGAFIDDTVITSKVKTAILQDETLKVMEIHVSTYKNVVQLSGFVDNAQIASRAGTVARDVKGVTSVRNDLITK